MATQAQLLAQDEAYQQQANNSGFPAAGVSSAEKGNASNHVAVLAVNTTLGAIAGGAALGLGKLLYTLPPGRVVINAATLDLAITQSQGHINADTPKVGLGSVIASGAISVLTGTATFNDVLASQTATDCNGTATLKTIANAPLVREASDPRTIYFNCANTWAASGDAAAKVTGQVVLSYTIMQ